MIPVLLTKIKTRDGITLEGIYVKPKRKSDTALIWLHGLTSRFSSGQPLIKELSGRLSRNGIGYFKFNSRGHDIAYRDRKQEYLGGGFERFEHCIYDIKAMIFWARHLGYKKIILAGSSTGANKALYYAYKTRGRGIEKLILVGPTSDIAFDYQKFGKKETKKRVFLATKFRKENPQLLVPQKYGIWSAGRLVSILKENMAEDVFPYHNHSARWKELRSVRVPVAVIFGSRDEYLDRPAKSVMNIFSANAKSSRNFSGVIIPGANHGFYKKEKELAGIITRWIANHP